jgi:hypothetical protein
MHVCHSREGGNPEIKIPSAKKQEGFFYFEYRIFTLFMFQRLDSFH